MTGVKYAQKKPRVINCILKDIIFNLQIHFKAIVFTINFCLIYIYNLLLCTLFFMLHIIMNINIHTYV